MRRSLQVHDLCLCLCVWSLSEKRLSCNILTNQMLATHEGSPWSHNKTHAALFDMSYATHCSASFFWPKEVEIRHV